ncbi:MAG: hypothetical protein A3A28_05990 [Candidatus Sungbacteria bacterium RIFCSPLOWO2_01_FULL_47_32]|nr:MAG: hypothetical protein A3A28_05990 [Candidatus Sungbacteria bacterium RIFCSPLOWO2_01_FULL_47_32]
MINELKQNGLSEKEARVYLAALELGKGTVQDIAKKAGVNRTTVYVMITVLEKRGLMKQVKIGKRSFFVAENPDAIISMLHKEKNGIEDREREMRKILPELKTLFNVAPGRPKIRFYEGTEVYKKIAEDIFEADTREILEIYNADLIRDVISDDEAKEFYKKRLARGIFYRALYTRKEGPFRTPPEKAEERFLSKEEFPVSGNIFIYGNRVGMASLKGSIIGVIIESDEISETLKSLFELGWESGKKRKNGKEDPDDDLLIE